MLQRAELREKGKILVEVPAPCDLPIDRLRADIVVGRHLIARVHHRIDTGMRHMHGAFQHGDTRTLDAGVDRENGFR